MMKPHSRASTTANNPVTNHLTGTDLGVLMALFPQDPSRPYQEEKDEYPPEILEESERLSLWIKELKNLYRHRLSIKLIDVKSIAGIYKSLRHRIRKYPTFIIDGKKTYSGWDKNQLEDLLDQGLKAF